jgi:hypothetical protein
VVGVMAPEAPHADGMEVPEDALRAGVFMGAAR